MRTILVLLTLTLALPAAAHTPDELDVWLETWFEDDVLNGQLLAELADMLERHPYWGDPPVTTTTFVRSNTGS